MREFIKPVRVADVLSLKDWTFDELVRWSTWHVISSLTRGDGLQNAMREIVITCINWCEQKPR